MARGGKIWGSIRTLHSCLRRGGRGNGRSGVAQPTGGIEREGGLVFKRQKRRHESCFANWTGETMTQGREVGRAISQSRRKQLRVSPVGGDGREGGAPGLTMTWKLETFLRKQGEKSWGGGEQFLTSGGERALMGKRR